MMIISPLNLATEQDSIKFSPEPSTIMARQNTNTIPVTMAIQPLPDTSLICKRNSVADVTFYDSVNFITTLKTPGSNRALFSLTEKSRVMQAEKKAILVKSLRTGGNLPAQPFHGDWIILILLVSAFLYSIVRTTSKKVHPVLRFFLFRGVNDPESRDTGGLFHWQSTLLNIVSFSIISIFIYHIASYYNATPANIPGIVFWLISLGVITVSFTLRHVICMITGSLSGQKDAFSEYLISVHQSYRFAALILLVVILLISFTVLFPVSVVMVIGIFAVGFMYLFRVIRLLLIFINRKISIFYLILYLCALEILPVAIMFRYFSDLG